MIHALIGHVMTMSCAGMNATESKNGTCIVQAYDNYPNGRYEETLFCTFSNCDIAVSAQNTIDYHCTTSACNCSSYATKCSNVVVQHVVKNMKGKAHVHCIGSDCTITQQEFPGEIAALCSGAECLTSYRPPPTPPTPSMLYVYVTVGVGGGILLFCLSVLTVSVLVSCMQDRALYREYKSMHGETHGAKIELRRLNYMMDVMEHGKRVRRKFLTDINHTVQPGSVTAIMGPSGAGKTTLRM